MRYVFWRKFSAVSQVMFLGYSENIPDLCSIAPRAASFDPITGPVVYLAGSSAAGTDGYFDAYPSCTEFFPGVCAIAYNRSPLTADSIDAHAARSLTFSGLPVS